MATQIFSRHLISLVLGGASMPLWAQNTDTLAPGVGQVALFQMLLGLGLIIGLLFVGTYIVRRMHGGRLYGHAGPLKVVANLTIGPRERLLLIEIEEKWLVVGVVPGQIKTLHVLNKGELPSAALQSKPFSHWLKQMSSAPHHEK